MLHSTDSQSQFDSSQSSELVRKRLTVYVGLVLFLLAVYIPLTGVAWKGSTLLHTVMEVAGTVLAGIVGAIALTRFYTRKNNLLLYIGTAFIGTAFLDGYHSVVTSSFFSHFFPSAPPSLIPWSWNASRTFLAIIMCLSWWGWRWEKQLGPRAQHREGLLYSVVGLLTLACFAFFAFYPLPRAYYPELFFGRPEEFVAGLFFAIALYGYVKKGDWKTDSFEHYCVIALIIGLFSQVVVMSRSFGLFDAMFDFAHLLKIISYGVMLVGLLINMRQLFLQSEKNIQKIEQANNRLRESVTRRTEAEEKLRTANLSLEERAESLEKSRANALEMMGEANVARQMSEETEIALQDASERQAETISALEIAHEEIKTAYHLAAAATRSKTEFLANMSHEIRTPMTAILGYSEIVLGNVDKPENIEALQTIQRNGQYLLDLINGILDISKIESGKMEMEQIACSPCQLLADVASLMRVRAFAKGLSLKIAYEGPIPQIIQTDPTRLRQVLINLIGNAIKFTEIGEVRIIMQVLNPSGDQPRLQFSVVDSGIGMTEKQMENLFQPFVQADTSTTRQFGGTGLGLTISKRFSEMLGGDITVESLPGQGSVFNTTISTGSLKDVQWIEKPSECEAAIEDMKNQNVVNTRKPIDTSSLAGYRVLLAEDGLDNQRLISFILKKAGAEVVIAENGQIAYDCALAAQGTENPFNVVLMDMQMPILDGYKATAQLRKAGFHTPIIALTAHAMSGDRKKCLDAGCIDYTTKPIDRKKLISLINHYSAQPVPTETAIQ